MADSMSSYPNLYVSHKIKNGIMEKDEIDEIQNFFNEKQFNKQISKEDLKDLSLEFIDKDLLISMFNEMIVQDYQSNISKYGYLSEGEYRKDDLANGYKYQISVIPFRTGILYVYIDIISENGKYLSDLIDNNKATSKQTEMYNNIQKISKYIVENQLFDISEKFPSLNQIDDYKRLFKLLKTYDSNTEWNE